MAKQNEQKVTEQTTANFVAEMTENGNFVVTREPIRGANGKQLKTQDGRLYFAYLLRGKLRNRDVKVDFSPKDKGGYELLDLLFEISPKAELIISEVVQEMNGVKSRRTVYTLGVIDENDKLWKSEVKPTRTSDRDTLALLINFIGTQIKTETEENPETA